MSSSFHSLLFVDQILELLPLPKFKAREVSSGSPGLPVPWRSTKRGIFACLKMLYKPLNFLTFAPPQNMS